MTIYKYVGPAELLSWSQVAPARQLIQREADILAWLERTQQTLNDDNEVIVTFIVDLDNALWIADRHSEHVTCANGRPILAAGEMTFAIHAPSVRVVSVTNQSTGYCPAPTSWPQVADALERVGLSHPRDFSPAFQFRLCDQCGSINIIKDDWFVCSVCDSELSQSWNFGRR